MKKLITILLIVISLNGISQTSKITGSWLMTKAETEEGIEEPYFITTFSNEGKMIVLDMEVGSWKYDKKTHSLILKSDFDEDFNGTGKIQSVSDTELIILKDNTTLYYTKVDEEKVAKANQNSKLVGTWRFQKNDWTNSLLKFELPDSFVFVETEDGMRTSYRGNWMYNPKQNNVIIMGLHSYVSGKYTIELLADEKLVLKNKDISIHATKEETSTAQVSRLDFTEHEFYTEDGDFKYYDDEEKLPWLNYYDLIMYLQNVNQFHRL